LLNDIDIDSGHVLLEALVVEFNVGSFIDMGTQIGAGASGKFSDFFLDVANLAGNTVSFTRVADAVNTTSFTAMLNLLIEDEEARVISRPYLSTVSGSSAHLEVAEDRFVVVQAPTGLSVTVQEISSGIILDILPIVTRDNVIMLDIGVNESEFIPTLGNIEQRRSRNTIKTSAHVNDGETVIIGGLMLRTNAHSNAGVPGVRDVPIMRNLFYHNEDYIKQTQVMIFVTPHQWRPGLDLPLLNQDEWSIYDTKTENFDPD
ncbi:MAG: type II and III secretion system protein, partial [Gammaproteobacteria bacterium]|nr:type II and III secretion system protein [Gammaproteobacteria bacterium]